MSSELLPLEWLPGSYTIVQLAADAEMPEWALNAPGMVSITRTASELSIVVGEEHVPDDIEVSDSGWVALRITGAIDFSQSGILSKLIEPLAAEEISIFAISTYETDILLTKGASTIATRQVLSQVADVSNL
jgi:hypothetical protein